jgi:hypothetical protein
MAGATGLEPATPWGRQMPHSRELPNFGRGFVDRSERRNATDCKTSKDDAGNRARVVCHAEKQRPR